MNRAIVLFGDDAQKMLGEIRQSIASGDAAGVRRGAHGLKARGKLRRWTFHSRVAAVLEDRSAKAEPLAHATSTLRKMKHEVERLAAALNCESVPST